jgi:hypothetical protein
LDIISDADDHNPHVRCAQLRLHCLCGEVVTRAVVVAVGESDDPVAARGAGVRQMGQTDSDRAVERCCCTQQSSVAGVRNEIWMTCFTIQLTKRTCAAIGGNQRADFARDHRLVASLARHGQVGRDGATERHHHDGVFVIDVGLEDV